MTVNLPIPEIRKRLYQLADEHGLDELRELADASYRKPPLRVTPRRFAKPTPDQKRQVIELAETFIHMPMREIGRRVGIDQGRVSEILNAEARRKEKALAD